MKKTLIDYIFEVVAFSVLAFFAACIFLIVWSVIDPLFIHPIKF